MAVRILSTGDEHRVEPANGRFLTSGEVRAAIGGGWTENVQTRDGRIMIVDSDGWDKRLPLNTRAGELYGDPLAIAGDAIVLSRAEFQAYDNNYSASE